MSGPKGIDYYIGDGKPALAGDTFAVIKASEGASFPPDGPIPDWYTAEQARIRASGAVFGAYHFWHPGDDNAAQTANFVRRAQLRPGDVVQLDMEATDGLDWATITARKNDMQRRLRAALPQSRILTYTYLDYWNHVDHQLVDGLWIADPSAPAGQPRVASWVIHQYASSSVDYDVANFPDAAALRAWATGLIPHPAPAQEVPMSEALFDVQADPANPAANPGIWWLQADGSYTWVASPADKATIVALGVKEGPISFAMHQRILATRAAASVTVNLSSADLVAAFVAAVPQLAAATAHALAVQEHADTPAS